MANQMSIDQVSLVLRNVISQATGQTELAALDTKQLLTIGKKLLETGVDPVMNAISQVISRTIFSNRPYRRKFGDMQRDPETWGNIVRKVSILETPNDLQNNDYIPLTDGGTVDQYKISKPKALELRFVGQQTYEIVKTIFDTQLNVAFNSEAEFGSFMSMVFTYVYNKIEKLHEETARATISGFIAGKIVGDTSNVIHLLSEYKSLTGLELTAQDVYKPEYFGDFMKWVYSRIEEVSNLMTEYSIKYHTNLEDGVIMRHTPKEYQRILVYAPVFYQTTSRVLADTYHDSFLKLPGAEMVNFWQNIDEPDTINVVTPQYLGADGQIVTTDSDLSQSNVFGVLYDREAMGYSPILTRTKTSPYNARGEYRNMFWKFNERHWMDFTENGVVFLLD